MSPEQAKGESVDERSDLFSLGSLIYTMLAGHAPFRASEPMAILHRVCHAPQSPLHRINSEIPLEVSNLVDKLLAKNPKHRFSSAQELRDTVLELSRSPRRLLRSSQPTLLRWGAVIGLAASLVFGIGLFETCRTWIAFWSIAPSDNEANKSVGILSSKEASDTEGNAKVPGPNTKSSATTTSSFGNTIGVFDGFQEIDRELIRLQQEAGQMLRAIQTPQVDARDIAVPVDRLDPAFERLMGDTKRLASEL